MLSRCTLFVSIMTVLSALILPSPNAAYGSSEIALVTQAGSGEVAVISIDQAKVLRRIDLSGASLPGRIAVSPDGNTAVICSILFGYVSFIDLQTMRCVKTLKLQFGPEQHGSTLQPNEFHDVVITPDGETALVTEGNEDGEIFFIGMDTMEVSGPPLFVGDENRAVVVDSAGLKAYVLDDNYMHTVTLATRTAVTSPLGYGFGDFVLTPDESKAILVGPDNSIHVYDATTWTSIDVLPIGAGRFMEPWQAGISPAGTLAISADATDPSITFATITGSTLAFSKTLDVGAPVSGNAFTSDGQKLVIALPHLNAVKIVDVATQEVSATITERMGLAPFGVAIVEVDTEPSVGRDLIPKVVVIPLGD